MQFVWMVIVGFVVGLIARAVLPGDQKLGIILTAVLGIVGSLAAGFVGQALGWYQAGEGAGFIGSIVGAVVVLFLYGKFANKASTSSGGGPGPAA
ncbi:MAG TPA: GlsB/YeaQ/YmgE family stress response membrane protein [Burkholderiaceae bacterium]